MTIRTSKKAKKRKRFLLPGFLESYLINFTKELSKNGYTDLTTQLYYDSVAHFGTWLHKKHVSLKNINSDIIDLFAKHRCRCPGGRKKEVVSKTYVNRVKYFVSYLQQCDIIPNPSDSTRNQLPSLLIKFKESLYSQGLKTITIDTYMRLLSKLLLQLGSNPKKYNAALIRRIIYNSSKKCSLGAIKNVSSVLKKYLRFLSVEKLCPENLDAAIPVVAKWSNSSLPKYLRACELERVISSCNLNKKQGLRDKAILLLLGRLGLRAGDIINMSLDDINWNEGTIRVCGKGRKEAVLPLPQEVGDALLRYIKKARARVPIKKVFLCLRAPFRALPDSSNVSVIVKAGIRRAGIINPPSHGANLMRHSAATSLLRKGSTLETVSAVLRHSSLNMTSYYAKVDTHMLMQITQPWPTIGSCRNIKNYYSRSDISRLMQVAQPWPNGASC